MPKTYICTEVQAVWDQRTLLIEVPDEVVAEGDKAINEFLHEAYEGCDYQEVDCRCLGNVASLDSSVEFEPMRGQP